MAVANRGLSHLGDQCLSEPQEQVLEGPLSLESLLQDAAAKAVAVASTLDDRTARCCLTAHEERNTDHPLIPGNRYFCRSTAFQDTQERHDAVRREVDVVLRCAGLVE